jgi:hypothetical protein
MAPPLHRATPQEAVMRMATRTTVARSTSAATLTQVATVVAYTAIVDVANPDEALRPGMTAEVTFLGAR